MEDFPYKEARVCGVSYGRWLVRVEEKVEIGNENYLNLVGVEKMFPSIAQLVS